MKKTLLVCMVALFVVIAQSFGNSKYRVDDTQIESIFDNAISVQKSNINLTQLYEDTNARFEIKEGKSPIAAFVICWLLGGIAIHRVYLGGTPVLIVGYLFTFFGFFGLIPFGDWIVLLVSVFKNDLGKYEGSDAFIMW